VSTPETPPGSGGLPPNTIGILTITAEAEVIPGEPVEETE